MSENIELDDNDIKNDGNGIQDSDKQELERLAIPLVKFLNKFHPHMKIIIENSSIEWVERIISFHTNEYLKD